MPRIEPARQMVELPPCLAEKLTTDDDPMLWKKVLQAAAADASTLSMTGNRKGLYATVGSCSHWLRPHGSRWTAAGGFALPEGYGDGEGLLRGLPNLDWNVTLQFGGTDVGWASPQRTPTTRIYSVRLAIPTRTARHRQAAVHATWSPGTLRPNQKRTVYYGFRKSESGWKLVARDEFGEGWRQDAMQPASSPHRAR
jgi:hypothetical protein